MNAILAKIAHHRRLRRLSSLARWFAAGLLLLLLPLAAGMAIDSSKILATPWRWTFAALVLLGALYILVTAFRVLRTPDRATMARLLDQHAGLEHGHVIATSLALSGSAENAVTPEEKAMLERLDSEALRLAEDSEPRHPWPHPAVILGALGVAVYFIALLVFQGPLPLQRILMPWQDLRYTTIELTGPADAPLVDQSFTVQGTMHGRLADLVTLQPSAGPAVTAPVAADGSFRYTFDKGVPASLTLVATGARDGVSAPLTVKLRDLPQPVAYSHVITPPAYTGQGDRTETQASFSILRASRTAYIVTMDKPAASVRLVLDNEPVPVVLPPVEGKPLMWAKNLGVLPRTTGYRMEVQETAGAPFRPVGEPQQILVLPDKPPVAEIASHNEKDLKSPRDVFKMKMTARDDVGLSGMRVVYYKAGDPDQKKAVLDVTPNALSADGTLEIPLASLKVEPHDIVVVIAQAVDNNTLDGRGLGNSEPLMIDVPDEPGAGGGGGGGGGQADKRINPLTIEKKIYRDTLMLSLGRGRTTAEDLARRQTENNKNMADMAEAAQEQDMLLAAQINVAQREGIAASKLLNTLAQQPGASAVKAADQEARVISALSLAARMMKNLKEQGEGRVEIEFSLDDKASQDDPASEEEKIKRALAQIQEAQAKQNELNEKLEGKDGKDGKEGEEGEEIAQQGEKPGEGQEGKDGKEGKDGQAQNGKQPGDKPSEGQGQGEGGQPGDTPGNGQLSPEQLAQAKRDQLDAQKFSKEISRALNELQLGKNGIDPANAALEMNRAAELQGQAAGSSGAGATVGRRFRPGFEAEKAIDKARVITESLLGDKSSPATATQPGAPPVYQDLIQQYSRRMSYDE